MTRLLLKLLLTLTMTIKEPGCVAIILSRSSMPSLRIHRPWLSTVCRVLSILLSIYSSICYNDKCHGRDTPFCQKNKHCMFLFTQSNIFYSTSLLLVILFKLLQVRMRHHVLPRALKHGMSAVANPARVDIKVLCLTIA